MDILQVQNTKQNSDVIDCCFPAKKRAYIRLLSFILGRNSYNYKVFFHSLFYLIAILINFVDWITGFEIFFGKLQIIPLFFYCYNKVTSRKQSLVYGVFATFAWTLVLFQTHYKFSNSHFLYTNFSINLALMTFLAFIFFKLKVRKYELKEKISQLKVANLEKNKYMGMAAHDIRNPLTSVNIMVELLKSDNAEMLNEKQIHYLKFIENSSRKMTRLLNELLDYSAIESGILNLHKIPQDYIKFILGTIENNKYLALSKNVTIKLEFSDASIELCFDGFQLEQVMDNLLSNAIKYSHRGSFILVRLEKSDSWVKTEVIDRGVGMDITDQSKIFRPFFKGESKPTGGEISTGLGLAISQKVIQAHNGEIFVESEVGKGSKFYFVLAL
ncbi:MAG: HAMP domain-containing histidine kinase [Leptospiraceae bacterium]|nr:HAMP domain-containing histidine kinase [Leptospiraceae bacterium]MCP5495119.1 HAMP domain-containing histidine kinase [Leptospiraceae bacterium]